MENEKVLKALKRFWIKHPLTNSYKFWYNPASISAIRLNQLLKKELIPDGYWNYNLKLFLEYHAFYAEEISRYSDERIMLVFITNEDDLYTDNTRRFIVY